MSNTTSAKRARLDALNEAIERGAKVIEYDGNKIEYRTVDEMYRIRDGLLLDLNLVKRRRPRRGVQRS